MAWTCADCGSSYLFDPPSKWQPNTDEDDGPVCSDCRDANS